MKLAIINASPRGNKSNSRLLATHFLNGYYTIHADKIEIHNLASLQKMDNHLKAFCEAETAIIFLPLYTDAMPGILKDFMEKAYLNNQKPKKLAFVIQSGFPEAYHSIFVERYLKKYTKRLGTNYTGSIIKGGVEGIQIMPPWMTKKLFNRFIKLGEYFAKNTVWDPKIKAKLMKPYHFSAFRIILLKILIFTGLSNYYWNSNLKKNKAFNKRFAKPYDA